jgi:phosphomannomutase
MIHSAVLSGLLSAGCEVVDLGVCPTPVLQFSVTRQEAAGAISISGGHNAMGWNALTLIGADGAVLEPAGGEEVLDNFHANDFLRQDWEHMGSVRMLDGFADAYFDALEDQLDTDAIRHADLAVLIDPVGGSGCDYLEPFARRLGVSLVPVNAQPSGYLARDPEPRPRSALQMASFIEHLKGDVGFVLSSDMGRLSIVTEDGEPASEEYTLAIIANHVLDKQLGPIVTNCCTSRTIDDIAALRKVPVIKTRVGQAYIVSTLADEQGIIGGEGSGSVALPGFQPAFDGFLMMGLILEAMAQQKSRISDLLKAVPRYHMVKKKVLLDSRDGYRALEILKQRYDNTDGTVDLTDGFRVDWTDSWVHVRPSRTQQLTRIISEAASRSIAEQRAEDIMRVIEHEV